MEWTFLKEKQPIPEHVGNKVLLYRIMNDSQSMQSITIHDTRMVKHCNPNETWWAELPHDPCVQQANELLPHVSKQRELLYSFITWYNAKPKKKRNDMVFINDVEEFLKQQKQTI